jgi:hypothetical protein
MLEGVTQSRDRHRTSIRLTGLRCNSGLQGIRRSRTYGRYQLSSIRQTITKAARRWFLYPHHGSGELMSPLSWTISRMAWLLPVFLSVSTALSRLLRLNTLCGRCGVLNSWTNAVWGAQSLRVGVYGTMGGRARHEQAAIPFAESQFKRT